MVQADWMAEVPLPGGFVNHVVRAGETVHRPPGNRTPFVRRLLDLFHQRGWAGAPRFLGFDDADREVLSFLAGHVAWAADQPPELSGRDCLIAVAQLVRQFHDLTAGTPLAADQEVVCHNDLSPKNTVYRGLDGAGLRPVAFIDWDLAAPGARIHDVAHVCWQYIGLGSGGLGVDEAARRIEMVSDAYGLDDRHALIETVLWWQDRCWRGIEAAAAGGDPAMTRLRDSGAADQYERTTTGWPSTVAAWKRLCSRPSGPPPSVALRTRQPAATHRALTAAAI